MGRVGRLWCCVVFWGVLVVVFVWCFCGVGGVWLLGVVLVGGVCVSVLVWGAGRGGGWGGFGCLCGGWGWFKVVFGSGGWWVGFGWGVFAVCVFGFKCCLGVFRGGGLGFGRLSVLVTF